MTRPTLAVAAVLAASTALVGAVAGQQAPMFRAGADLVIVDVSVRDGSRAVTGLRAADFLVLDNGVPQQVEAVALERLPIDLTLLLDVSASVRGRLFDRLKLSVLQAAKLLSPDDRLRVVGMQSRVEEIVPFQPGGASPTLDHVLAQGGTSLFDGLIAVMMRSTQPERRQLIVAYTDGLDTTSLLDLDTAREVALRADAVLHLVMPVEGLAKTRGAEKQPPNAAMLRDLAARTGGQLFLVDLDAAITQAFERSVDEFRTSYVLRYVPKGVRREGWHEIVVTVPGGKYDVRARKGYAGGPSSF